MTHFALRLVISYSFDRPVGAGRQLFRILPAAVPGLQRLISTHISLTPQPTEQRQFTDFFGTEVIEVAMPPGMTALELALTARVERLDEGMLDLSTPLAQLPVEIANHRSVGAFSPHHFTQASRVIPFMPDVASYAQRAVTGAHTTRDAVEMLGQALHRDMSFDANATKVDTPPAEAFALRRGVCQDFAQIMIGGLRAVGIPAAYVGGYLRTLPPPGKPRLVGADAMHAWVRAWGGEEMGWIDYDPTNACFARTDHIDVGFGRDYTDVTPVTGMLRLDGTQTGTHSVDIIEV